MTEYYSYYYNHNRRTATTNCFYSYVDADDSDDDKTMCAFMVILITIMTDKFIMIRATAIAIFPLAASA